MCSHAPLLVASVSDCDRCCSVLSGLSHYHESSVWLPAGELDQFAAEMMRTLTHRRSVVSKSQCESLLKQSHVLSHVLSASSSRGREGKALTQLAKQARA